VGVAAVLLLVTACGDPSTRDFCTQYQNLVGAVEELQATDPATADVDEVRAAANDVTVALDQFQAVSEGRLDDAITRVRDRVDNVRQAAVAGAQALEDARPLIEDDLAQLRSAWAQLQDFAETQCPATE
jgi:ABC-type transporter Mla subunit MlaD